MENRKNKKEGETRFKERKEKLKKEEESGDIRK